VDQAKRKDNKKKFGTDVEQYVEAVTRAATDLGRRETRLEILENRLQNALKKVSKSSGPGKKP
jgi:flagellin-like hook-associated protein FlgL